MLTNGRLNYVFIGSFQSLHYSLVLVSEPCGGIPCCKIVSMRKYEEKAEEASSEAS
jgi:hypothetical protein